MAAKLAGARTKISRSPALAWRLGDSILGVLLSVAAHLGKPFNWHHPGIEVPFCVAHHGASFLTSPNNVSPFVLLAPRRLSSAKRPILEPPVRGDATSPETAITVHFVGSPFIYLLDSSLQPFWHLVPFLPLSNFARAFIQPTTPQPDHCLIAPQLLSPF